MWMPGAVRGSAVNIARAGGSRQSASEEYEYQAAVQRSTSEENTGIPGAEAQPTLTKYSGSEDAIRVVAGVSRKKLGCERVSKTDESEMKDKRPQRALARRK
eukprot:scpid100853/ scgid31257/ 